MDIKADLLLTIVSHRAVSAHTVHCLEVMRDAYESGYLKFNYKTGLFVGDALIGRGRSQACSRFLEETEIPYMLFIDDDIIFTPQDVEKIYNLLKQGYDVIGGIYPVKGAVQLSSYGWNGKLMQDGKIYEIEFLATGFMGISRKILLKIKDELKLPLLNPNDWSKCYPFFESGRCMTRENADPIYISEDWDFCQKVRQVGSKVYADTSVQLGHVREEVFTPQNVVENQSRDAFEKQVYGSMRKQQELILSVDTDLSEFLKQPLSEVQSWMGQASQDRLAEMWNQHKDSTESFYKDNLYYLYDLAGANRYLPYFQNRIGSLVNITGIKTLDMGCGIGTVTFMMAGQGCEAMGWDINKLCIGFCKYKQQKYNLGGKFSIKKPDLSQFDLITAVDFLEHIEDLEGFLKMLGKEMKSGAKLYHSDYFPKHEGVWPMHFEENAEHLSQWLKEAGFIEWDSIWAIKI